MKDTYNKWKTLCTVFEVASDTQLSAQASVAHAFARLDEGACGENFPKELETCIRASQRLAKISRELVDFVEAHASWIPSH